MTMQTFLPEQTFSESAAALDRQRLGKQRVECIQLLKALAGDSRAWANHPACRMWRGHEQALAAYGVTVCDEWTARGYKDTCREKIVALANKCGGSSDLPPWYDAAFIRAHRSNLIRKLPEYYAAKWPDVPADLPYIWPI